MELKNAVILAWKKSEGLVPTSKPVKRETLDSPSKETPTEPEGTSSLLARTPKPSVLQKTRPLRKRKPPKIPGERFLQAWLQQTLSH